jgi:hypothetical protein
MGCEFDGIRSRVDGCVLCDLRTPQLQVHEDHVCRAFRLLAQREADGAVTAAKRLPVRYPAADDARELIGIDAAERVFGINDCGDPVPRDRIGKEIMIATAQRAWQHAYICGAYANVNLCFSASARLDIDFDAGMLRFEALSDIVYERIHGKRAGYRELIRGANRARGLLRMRLVPEHEQNENKYRHLQPDAAGWPVVCLGYWHVARISQRVSSVQ